jgi:manganese/zinc/iron transport system permease protein
MNTDGKRACLPQRGALLFIAFARSIVFVAIAVFVGSALADAASTYPARATRAREIASAKADPTRDVSHGIANAGLRVAQGSIAPLGDAADQSTQDALNALDASPSTIRPKPDHAANPTPSMSTPASAPDAAPTAFTERIDWRALLLLFAPALITAAAIGVSGSIVGTLVLLRREALAALAIPQVVAVGAALGMRQGWPTLPPALVAAAVGLFYLVMSKRWGAGNWILPSLYIAGLCLSFLLIANKGQDVADLQKLFTGIDVAVTPARAAVAAPVLLIVGLACALLWRRWLLMAQAPAAAELAGLHPARWDALFFGLLTIVVLLGTDSLGVVMVLLMLFLPGATVLPWSRSIRSALVAAAIMSLLFLAAGFVLSNEMSWPLSQSVGGAGFGALVLSHLTVRLRPARRA